MKKSNSTNFMAQTFKLLFVVYFTGVFFGIFLVFMEAS